MPRPLRVEIEGGVHHVFARGNCKQAIYLDDRDRRIYLAMLDEVVRRTGWSCLAYCLMNNHVHLLVETPRPNLGAGMQRLHGRYAQRFNQRHRRTGHLFQGRYGAVPIGGDEQLWMAVRYIARNPVSAGLCDAAGNWPWSSHAATLVETAPGFVDVARLLSYFEALGGDPWRRYVDLVTAA